MKLLTSGLLFFFHLNPEVIYKPPREFPDIVISFFHTVPRCSIFWHPQKDEAEQLPACCSGDVPPRKHHSEGKFTITYRLHGRPDLASGRYLPLFACQWVCAAGGEPLTTNEACFDPWRASCVRPTSSPEHIGRNLRCYRGQLLRVCLAN